MKDIRLLLYLEEESDVVLVEKILSAANYPLEQIKILAAGGKKNIANFLNNSWKLNGVKYAALISLDFKTVFEAIENAKEQLGNPDAAVFCAVPSIDTWLFADIEAAKKNVCSKHGRKLLERIPLPEEIPYPTRLAYAIFGQKKYKQNALKIFDDFDLKMATSRSYSLRIFIEGVGKLLNIDNIPISDVYTRNINREVFLNLLNEISPVDTVIYRTRDGINITVKEMLEHVQQGSPVGQRYVVDMMRTARNFLAQQAQREQEVKL